MLLLVGHIICALVSLVVTVSMVIRPSRRGLRLAYILTGLTFVSGTILVIGLQQPVASSCLAGLVYLSVITVGLVRARHVLALAD
jgi:hypothetical protein